MSVRTCERAGCDRPHAARGLCQLHYGREHDQGRTRKRSGKKTLRNRARTRAVAMLIAAHPGEFARLLDDAQLLVEAEAALVADALGAPDPDVEVPALRPGPASVDDEDPVDRVSVKERCPTCETYHDAGHVCPTCADAAAHRCSVPDRPQGTAGQIRRALEGGKKAQWLVDQGFAYADVLATVRLINAERKGQKTDERQPA